LCSDFIVAPFFLTLLNALPRCVKPVDHLVMNRRKWNTMLMTRLADTPMEEDKREEARTKWTKKEADFEVIASTQTSHLVYCLRRCVGAVG